MKQAVTRLLFISFGVLVVFCGNALGSTQKPDRIGRLINELNDKREYELQEASEELIKMGPRVLPRLISSLKTRNGCSLKLNAARVVLRLDPQQPSVKSALFDVATYKCKHSLSGTLADSQVYILNTVAAMVLAEEVEDGLPLVVKLFDHESEYVRDNAARGLGVFARAMKEAANENRAISEKRIAAFKTALPLMVKALHNQNETVRCVTFFVLSSLQKSSPRELQVEAERALQGLEVRCS